MKKQNHTFSILLSLLAGTLVIGNFLKWPIPLAGDDRRALLTLGILGMALCAQGIGRISEDQRWTHPISLLGMLIGAITLALWTGRLFNLNLIYAETDAQAILTMSILMGSKFILARTYAIFRHIQRSDQNTV